MNIDIKLGLTGDDLKAECARIEQEIQQRYAEQKVLLAALRAYRATCSHPGQKTGWNERDGSWANPCPVCGDSR